ncbi:Universal stress protein phos32 [Ancistrocladus abbreviatus]
MTTYSNTALESDGSSSPAPVFLRPSSPSRSHHSGTSTAGANRRIAIAVDLSDESAYAVRWAVQNYLRPGDAVILLHVAPTSVLYGADWGSIDLTVLSEETDEESQQKLEDDFNAFTITKANDLAQPLVEGNVPFKIHVVKDHDMKERLCLEVERLGVDALIMGSRGFGAVGSRRGSKRGGGGGGRLGSVSDYCVHHCVCPVVVVRYPGVEQKEGGGGRRMVVKKVAGKDGRAATQEDKDEVEYHDASDKQTDMEKAA